MQNRVTIALGVLLACICSAWATHCDMMASSTSKICRNLHFSYTYSRCLRNLTSQSDSTPNFDLFKKKYQKRIIRHSFAKTFSKTAPKIQSFKTPFFSIIERFQRFPKNFLKTKFFEMCIMCRSNLASYIPPTGPLGISLPSFDIRGFHLLESEIL